MTAGRSGGHLSTRCERLPAVFRRFQQMQVAQHLPAPDPNQALELSQTITSIAVPPLADDSLYITWLEFQRAVSIAVVVRSCTKGVEHPA